MLDSSVCKGIWAGMRTVRYFDGKAYAWVGLSRQPSIMDKVCLLCFPALDAWYMAKGAVWGIWILLQRWCYLCPSCLLLSLWNRYMWITFSCYFYATVIHLGLCICRTCLHLSFQVLSSLFVFLGVFDGIILLTCFVERSRLVWGFYRAHPSIKNVCTLRKIAGEKVSGAIHTSILGQRWMESSNGTDTVCTSACVGNVDFDSWGECFLSETLPLDTSAQPSQLIPSTDLVAHCKSSDSGVQFLPPDKVRRFFIPLHQYDFCLYWVALFGVQAFFCFLMC
jgi:hypothetical protein